jgi:hypothetical protein
MDPDIAFDYDRIEIEAASSRLDRVVRDILPMLESLRADVSDIFQDGLMFKESSGAMKKAYEEFNINLRAATKGINVIAKQFREVRNQMMEMDSGMAGEIHSGGQ